MERAHHILSLFSEGRDVSSYATELRRSFLSTEAAGNLLAHFEHSEIALCQNVVKGDLKIVGEGHHLCLVGL